MGYFTYIVTNPSRTVLYTGVTKDLARRLGEHHAERGMKASFAGRYYCYNLVWYEENDSIVEAIRREKEIKKFSRARKLALIGEFNPEMAFLTPP